ncbi:NUDIX domain-containing protein [Candidatus Woesearchaeota archaeon]|nr:NUDIX domain-containing protein [Candidatus Woesearchaeota archaeon]
MGGKDDHIIMAVPVDILFVNNSHFQGFKPHSQIEDYESRILEYKKFLRRGDLEIDPSHKQPIGYAVIYNPETKKIYAYKRAADKADYNEQRLYNKWSIGIGGHIEKDEEAEDNPIHSSLIREIDEETVINGSQEIKVIGYINDDRDSVGKVHFGVLYLVETDSDDVFPNDSESVHGEMMSLEEIKKIKDDPNSTLEGWSEIALEAVENHLK